MKILIDAREAFSRTKAGKGQWTSGFLGELLTRDISIVPLVDCPVDIPHAVSFDSGFLWHWHAARFAMQSDATVYVSPTSYIAPVIIRKSLPVVPIVHDLIAWRSEPHDMKATLIERILLPFVLRNAAHVCTVSESTKYDLLDQFPSLLSSSVSSIFAGPMRSTVPRSSPDQKTILCVGTLCPRKNQIRLIRAFASLPEEVRSVYRLVLVGARGWHDDDVVRYAQQTKGVEWLQYVSDDEYQQLLSEATIFAYPSLYEGFGMQVLDALQRGIPVVTSHRGSLAELVQDAALIVDPESERSIADGLMEIVHNHRLREHLQTVGPIRAEQYHWKRTVDLFLQVVSSIQDSQQLHC